MDILMDSTHSTRFIGIAMDAGDGMGVSVYAYTECCKAPIHNQPQLNPSPKSSINYWTCSSCSMPVMQPGSDHWDSYGSRIYIASHRGQEYLEELLQKWVTYWTGVSPEFVTVTVDLKETS